MDILTLQKTLNTMLVPAGYTKLVEDGVLGMKTCGAAREFMPGVVPAECATKGYTAPTKAGAKTVSSVSTSVSTVPATTTTSMSLISSTKWIIGSSIAIGLGLVGFAVAKKKKWL